MSRRKAYKINSLGRVDNIYDLERLITNCKSSLINIYVAETVNKYKIENYHGASKLCYIASEKNSILLSPEFYNTSKEEIENKLYELGSIDNKKTLEELEEIIESNRLEHSNWTYNVIIDKYRYDEDFIRDIIGISKNRVKLNMQFVCVKVSDTIMFCLKKDRARALLYKENCNFRELSNDWITTNFLLDMKDGNAIYRRIPYNRIINSLDCIDEILKFDCIRFTNIIEGRPSYKSEINSIYLENIIEIAQNIRDSGYTKPIIIYCDSLNDICSLLSFSDNHGIQFSTMMGYGFDVLKSGESTISTCRNNNVFLKRRAQEIQTEELDLYSKIREIFITFEKELIKYKDNKDNKVKILLSHFYDMCKYVGLNPIKCNNPECYFFYDRHNPKVIKVCPEYIYHYFETINMDILGNEDNIELWNHVFEKSNTIEKSELVTYEEYLNADSIGDIVQIFLSRIDRTNNELNFYESDPYMDELKYLVSILMDISEDEYLAFKNNYSNITTYKEVISAIEYIGYEIIKNKKQQIGITMTYNKRLIKG